MKDGASHGQCSSLTFTCNHLPYQMNFDQDEVIGGCESYGIQSRLLLHDFLVEDLLFGREILSFPSSSIKSVYGIH